MSFWNGNKWVAQAPPDAAPAAKPESRAKGFAAAALEASLITALTFGLIAGTAFAAKGGGGGPNATNSGSSLAVVMVTDNNGNGAPNWNDTITFNVSTTATTTPHVNVLCYQGGVQVYSGLTGYYASYPWPWTQNMTLWSYSWSGGAADCNAKLYYFSGRKTITLTTLAFHVDA